MFWPKIRAVLSRRLATVLCFSSVMPPFLFKSLKKRNGMWEDEKYFNQSSSKALWKAPPGQRSAVLQRPKPSPSKILPWMIGGVFYIGALRVGVPSDSPHCRDEFLFRLFLRGLDDRLLFVHGVNMDGTLNFNSGGLSRLGECTRCCSLRVVIPCIAVD